MSTKSPKTGTGPQWVTCGSCHSSIITKDAEIHKSNCPPNHDKFTHCFIRNKILYSNVDVKSNEDIKSVTPQERNSMVFLSQSVIQLCDISIGNWALVKPVDNSRAPSVCLVWPTAEKSSTSVLFTKFCLENLFHSNINVSVSKIPKNILEARRIYLVALNGQKNVDFSSELTNRIQRLHLGRMFTPGNKISIMYFGKLLIFEVKSIEGAALEDLEMFEKLSVDEYQFYKVSDKTVWNLFKDTTEYGSKLEKRRIISEIGGLDDQINEIKNLMNAALNKTNIYLNSKNCRSVLLYGNSGTGKTMISSGLAEETKVNVVSINTVDLYTKYSSNVDETIRILYQESLERSPTLIILDEVDLLCPLRTNRLTDSEKHTVSAMLNMLDNISNLRDCRIFIIATTNKPDSIDPAFRRCGRLDREIEIPVPNIKGRLEILKKIGRHLEENVLIEVAEKTHGFVGADLVSLCSCAHLHCSTNSKECVDPEDFTYALTKVTPSAMREVQIKVPNVKWSDIGGQENLKLILKQAVEWPLKHPESFKRLGITPTRGVLMFGPPGCSKTMIAKALATESGLNFLSIKGPELFSKWVGESEKAVRDLFRKARQVAPSIIFFDEIDALGSDRSTGSSNSVQERVLAQLLTELDGVTPLGNVTILAATNRPDKMDKALLRPGRLDRIVYVPLPDVRTREDIFRIKLSKMPVQDVDIEELITLTEGYSGAEVNAVCHEAAMKALEENLEIEYVRHDHFKEALNLVKPRISRSQLKIYEDYINLKDNNLSRL